MASVNDRRDLWLNVLFLVMTVTGLAVLGLGVWQAWGEGRYALMGLGFLGVIVPATGYLVSVMAGERGRLYQQVQEQTRLLQQLNERVMISDQAKRIAYRQSDRRALRQAIMEEIRADDYDAAMALVNEMAETYGYRHEAEQFRQQIIDAQSKRRKEAMEAGIRRVDEHCECADWDGARREVNKLMRMYPDYPGVEELPKRIEAARRQHKNELERAFLEAAQRDDVDRAMELMTELDKYLTPEEAQPYLEAARGVVGKKRENLGVRFKMAVQDRNWMEAIDIGEQIIRDFPNTRFADEVRGMLDKLRDRAASQRATSSGAPWRRETQREAQPAIS